MSEQAPTKDLSMAMECRILGCQRSAAVDRIQELREQNAALMAECAHYREKLRELSSAAAAALTVKP
jgi:hypothetical protein